MAAIDYLQRFPQSILNRDVTSNLGKLWKIFSDQVDEVETVLAQMKLLYVISSQSGDNLDNIGTLVLLDRTPGQTDESYRLALSVAIAEKKSGGTIPEMAEIGKIVAGNDSNAVFRVDELWDEAGTILLDGEMQLDGSDILNPSEARAASIESPLSGNVDDIDAPTDVGDTIGRIRSAAIHALFIITFQTLVSQMQKYTTIYTTLGGDNELDNRQLLSPSGQYNIYDMAIGDGGTRDPLPSDTGLQNEVFREPVIFSTDDSGQSTYTINILASQLNTYTINEIAAFNSDGDMILKDYFSGKDKNANLVYNYQIIDNQNIQ
jgi:hypothetical protein